MRLKALFTFKALAWLVALNIGTTILHYVDNILFFGDYPEPAWLAPGMVDAFWFLMTPLALAGLWLAYRNRRSLGLIMLLVYAGISPTVPASTRQ